jgi:hypothetical protein
MDLLWFNRNESQKQLTDEDRELGMQLFREDPLYPKIDEAAASELLDLALCAGTEQAERLMLRYKCADPLRLARMLEIRVLFDITYKTPRGGLNILSSYVSTPPTITVYENLLRLCRENLLRREKVNRVFLSNLTNICVAHEIYHHMERKTLNFVNLMYKVPVFDIKLIRIEKSLTVLSEVAANAFAKKIMDLPGLPCVVNQGLRDV